MLLPPPFAVHIGTLLQPAWLAGGFVLGGLAVLLSLWKVNERDVPRIGVLTAAFFVASSVHLPLGGVSVHLLLNGLVGVILRWRSPLAVAVGLTLQTLLLSHGGPDALGVNFVVLTLPALLAGVTFRPLFRRMPAFAAGAIVGGGTAAVTVFLHATVLYFGSVDPSGFIAGVSLLAHLPVIVVEAIGVGFACQVLAKAKPEWLGLTEGPHPPSPSPNGEGVFKSDAGSVPPPNGENLGGLNTPSPRGEGHGGGGPSTIPIPLPPAGTGGTVDPSNG